MFKSCVSLVGLLSRNSLATQTTTLRTHECRFFANGVYQKVTGVADATESEAEERKRKIIETEVWFWHSSGKQVVDPTLIQAEQWQHLFKLKTASARKRFCRFLFVRDEAKRLERDEKAKHRGEAMELRTKKIEEKKQVTHIYYGLGGNSLLMRIWPATIKKWRNKKLLYARFYGPKLIFDCSYDDQMTEVELKSAGRQLHYSFAYNRRIKEPFDVHLCNVNSSSGTLHWLKKHVPNVLDASCPLSIHEQCFTELFPLDRLLYLSPDSDEDLAEYNANDILIVGAMVDKGPCQHLSLAQAKRLGIRHARLPLSKFVNFASGQSKRLTLNAMTSILLKWKDTNDWREAFRVRQIQHKLVKE